MLNGRSIRHTGRIQCSVVIFYKVEKVGITIDGNRLSIDEETFRSANVNTVKSLFLKRASSSSLSNTEPEPVLSKASAAFSNLLVLSLMLVRESALSLLVTFH